MLYSLDFIGLILQSKMLSMIDKKLKNITITFTRNQPPSSSSSEDNQRNPPWRFIYCWIDEFSPLLLLLCSSFSLTTSTLIRAYGLQFCRRSKQDFCPGGRGNGEWMRSWCEDRTSDWLLSYGEVWIAQGEGFGCESLDRGVSMLEYYPTFYLCFSASFYVIKLRAFLYIIILMIYFVRHAESIYNDAQKQIQHQKGPNYMKTQAYLSAKFDKKYLDVEITSHGQQQAQQARLKVRQLQIDIVLVSPMRRALHTCDIVFREHPSKAKIIVVPEFREIMESSNDIGSEIEESMKKYSFDFSQIKDREAWFVETLGEQDRAVVKKSLQGLVGEERKQKAVDQCLRIQKQNWFERVQFPQKDNQLKQRILPSYELQKKVLKHYSQKYKRIAIVAHSQCIKRYAGYKIANCQVFPYDLSNL